MSKPLFAHLVRYFSDHGWPFEADEPSGVVAFPAVGNRGEWMAYARAREEQGQLLVHSLLPQPVPEDRRQAMSIFTTRANFGMVMGNFELDLDSGELRFKTAIDIQGVPVTDELVTPLLQANLAMVDRYLQGVAAVIAGGDPEDAVRDAESA